MDKKLISTSKFLSLVLRHRPETIGVHLDESGWIAIDELIAAASRHRRPLTLDLVLRVVAQNDKQRFALSDDGLRIRANQGHSIRSVNLNLKPVVPPDVLYHGTVLQFLPGIRSQGLQKRSRNHVHLSEDFETARRVGMRRGKPVILTIKSAAMTKAGIAFYVSENGVWLTESVAMEFIDFPAE